MLLDGYWVLSDVRASDVRYGVATIPKLPETSDRPRPLSIVQAVYASAYSDYPDEAIDLLNYLAGPESAPDLHRALGRVPVRRDVLRLSEFRENREIKAWRDQATIGVPLPNVPELDYVWGPWGRALDEAIPGLTPAQEALDRAVEQIKEAIGDEEAP
jgi:arabinogalactan oligomer/maltooligosaccharide transport system substrate-binding protein